MRLAFVTGTQTAEGAGIIRNEFVQKYVPKFYVQLLFEGGTHQGEVYGVFLKCSDSVEILGQINKLPINPQNMKNVNGEVE